MRTWIVEYVYTDYCDMEENYYDEEAMAGYYTEVEAENEDDAVRQVLDKFTPIEITGVREG